MRLHLRLSPNTSPVSFDYQAKLNGTMYKWFDAPVLKDLHNQTSLYSRSWLAGSRANRNKTHLDFPRGATFFISFHDEAFAEPLIDNIFRAPDAFCGMSITQITQQPTPRFTSPFTFRAASPVLARQTIDEKTVKHLLYTDPEADEILTTIMRHKLTLAGFDEANRQQTRISFDRTYQGAKTKLVQINNIRSRASSCPVHVEGTPETVAFAWNVGIGHSTGSGFGSLV